MTTPTDTCPCGAMTAAACPGSWEPGCDLGNNPAHAVAATDPASTDAALGLVELPPIRIPEALHAELVKAAEARGLVIQAVVRECLNFYAVPTQPAGLRLVR